MSSLLYLLLAVVATFFGYRVFLNMKVNKILTDAQIEENTKKKEAYEKQAESLQKEIEDAKAVYDRALESTDKSNS